MGSNDVPLNWLQYVIKIEYLTQIWKVMNIWNVSNDGPSEIAARAHQEPTQCWMAGPVLKKLLCKLLKRKKNVKE